MCLLGGHVGAPRRYSGRVITVLVGVAEAAVKAAAGCRGSRWQRSENPLGGLGGLGWRDRRCASLARERSRRTRGEPRSNDLLGVGARGVASYGEPQCAVLLKESDLGADDLSQRMGERPALRAVVRRRPCSHLRLAAAVWLRDADFTVRSVPSGPPQRVGQLRPLSPVGRGNCIGPGHECDSPRVNSSTLLRQMSRGAPR